MLYIAYFAYFVYHHHVPNSKHLDTGCTCLSTDSRVWPWTSLQHPFFKILHHDVNENRLKNLYKCQTPGGGWRGMCNCNQQCFLFSAPLWQHKLKLNSEFKLSLRLKLTQGWTLKVREAGGSRRVWDLRGKFNPNQCFLSVGLFPAPPPQQHKTYCMLKTCVKLIFQMCSWKWLVSTHF